MRSDAAVEECCCTERADAYFVSLALRGSEISHICLLGWLEDMQHEKTVIPEREIFI